MKYLFLIIFLIICMFYLFTRKIEMFDNKDIIPCNNFFSNNSFCMYDVDNNLCNCRYQKDHVRYIFDSPENCCQLECAKRSKETCLDNKQFTKMPYYCNIAGKCKEYKGTINENHIMANNCGTDPLNNQLLLPYASLDECQKSLDPCDKYNDPSKSVHYNREICLKNVNCGYCTNDSGGGKCISGNASGANDLQKYFYCNPTSRSEINKYYYGDHAAALLQPANISSFANIPS